MRRRWAPSCPGGRRVGAVSEIDVGVVFRYAGAPIEDEAFRLLPIGDDPVYLLSTRRDDTIVAAGVVVVTQPDLALRAYRRPDIHATELPGFHRRLYAATYGEPPDPPAVAAVLGVLRESITPTDTGGAVRVD